MSSRACVVIVDGSIARTGALMGASNVAKALKAVADVTLVIPIDAAAITLDVQPFASIDRLPIAQLRRTGPAIATYLPKLIVSSIKLRRLLRRLNCQTLILNDFYLMHGVLCRIMGYRGNIVTWVRMDPDIYGRMGRVWMRLNSWASNEIVAVSDYVAGKISDVTPATVVYDPVPCKGEAVQAPTTGHHKRIVCVANYIPGKGQDKALDAFALISEKFPEAVLEFWGGDMGREKNKRYRNTLAQQAQRLKIAQRVSFNDFADDPFAVLSGAYLAINLSSNESFSMTVLEAGAAGIPVVATRCGGPEEIIVHETTGLLVPIGETGAASAAMARLLSRPDFAAQMGAAARAHVRSKFSALRYSDRLQKILTLPSFEEHHAL